MLGGLYFVLKYFSYSLLYTLLMVTFIYNNKIYVISSFVL